VANNNIGFWLVASQGNDVSNNTLRENRVGGMNLMFSSVNKLEGNIIINNNNYGIVVDYSSENNSLVGNSVTRNNGTGIMLGSALGSQLRNNTMADNKYNFHKVLSSPSLQDYIVDVDISNTVNGKPIYYLINKSNMELNPATTPNLGYLALVNSTNITVRNLNLNQNGQGLLLAFSTKCNLISLNITNNNFGIQLCSSNRTLISYCQIANNTVDGVTLDHYSTDDEVSKSYISGNKIGIEAVHSGTQNNTISDNHIINNEKGVWINSYCINNTLIGNIITYNELGIFITRYSDHNAITNNWIINNSLGLSIEYSSANTIYHNNFIENTVQAAAKGSSNTWDGGYPLGGNYWSDLACTDLLSGLHQNASGSDGVCDFHYVIDDDNQDRYPLMGLLNCFLYQAGDGQMLEIHVVSNSTISSFNINATHITISFNVSGETGIGFCRVTVPNIIVDEFWQSDYVVLVDEKPPLDLRSWKDGVNTYVYFTYLHPEHRVMIVPEWSSLILFTLVLILTTGTVTIARRKKIGGFFFRGNFNLKSRDAKSMMSVSKNFSKETPTVPE
jgi:parallel beta-helix repeat protein